MKKPIKEKITAKIMRVDAPMYDWSTRIYPREIVEAAIQKIVPLIKKKLFFVCNTSTIENKGVNLLDVMGYVTKMEIKEDGYVYANIEFVDTPAYIKFIDTISQMPWLKMENMFTTVALGSLQESYNPEELETVGDDYELLAVVVSTFYPGQHI